MSDEGFVITVDLTDVTEFEVVPEGTYPCTVFDIEQKTSSNGKPMLTTIFKVSQGEFEGRRFFRNMVMTPDSLWVFKGFLRALGFSKDDTAGTVNVSSADLLGLPCRVRVTQKEYQGEMRNEVKSVLPPFEDDDADLAAVLAGADFD